jgi:hypothetical protein
MDSTAKSGQEVINSISFNQDRSFAAFATSIGFKIYSTAPFALRHQRDFGTPLQFVELVGNTNLIGLVGEKETPFTPPNRLAIFDDSKSLPTYLRNPKDHR